MKNDSGMGHPKLMPNVVLAPYTTMGVGGQARCLARVSSTGEMVRALKWASDHKLSVFVLGGGSNVIFSDRGYYGMVLMPQLHGVIRKHKGNNFFLTVGAGEEWDSFVLYCIRSGLGGLECLSGIPGTVGAAPIQNIGAYGQDVSHLISSVRVYNRETGELEDHNNAWCEFTYRSSRFKKNPDKYIITAVTFCLKHESSPDISYTDLQDWFDARPQLGRPTLETIRQAVLEVRTAKGMVYDKNNVYTHGCGSFFTNPVVTQAEYEQVLEKARKVLPGVSSDKIPAYPASDGTVKLSAAWLIEASGFKRGTRCENKGLGLSPYHALAIINYGNACARQILEFMTEIQNAVSTKFGVLLTPEPNFVGFNKEALAGKDESATPSVSVSGRPGSASLVTGKAAAPVKEHHRRPYHRRIKKDNNTNPNDGNK